MSSVSLFNLIKSGRSKVFRNCLVKRRYYDTGLYETNWIDITKDVEKWGKITASVDVEKPGVFKLNNNKIVLSNDEGKYNPEYIPGSMWFDYAPQQRSLVKIQYGFYHQTLTSGGIYKNILYPKESLFDEAVFDASDSLFDARVPSWYGLIDGDIKADDSNSITFTLKPLTQIFVDYPVNRIIWSTATGISASRFIELLRDQTEGSGNYVFRPFFNDSTAYWNISQTSIIYTELTDGNVGINTEKSVWDVIESLCEVENFVAYVDNYGVFHFRSKTGITGTVFKFNGIGYDSDGDYGATIKRITSYGPKISSFYSRINVKFADADTSTSYVVKDSTLTVSGNNAAWNYGYKILNIDNNWIPNTTTAQTIADNLFAELGSVKKEIQFTTSFVPHMNILETFEVYYDTARTAYESRWDVNDWDTELIWDKKTGDALKLNGNNFKFISTEIDLDKFECKYIGRE